MSTGTCQNPQACGKKNIYIYITKASLRRRRQLSCVGERSELVGGLGGWCEKPLRKIEIRWCLGVRGSKVLEAVLEVIVCDF